MAVAVYTSDLTTLIPDDTTSLSNWAAIGGGASGLNIETDYFIQGSSCTSKNAFASATKGLVEDTTNTALTSGDLDAIYMWITHLTPGSLDTKANGGLALVAGSASNTLNRYNYAGSDTVDYGAPWICAVVDPENATASSGTVTPANMDTYGVEAKLVGGPTKGAPLGVDAIRQGRSYDITAGDVATPGTFTEAATKNDLQANRYGQFQGVTGGFSMQCRLGFGTAATAGYFKDANVSITLPDLEFVDPDFNQFEVVNSGSTLIWTNVTITALGTNAKGNFLVTASTLVEHNTCTFIDMGTFAYDANSVPEGTVYRRCDQITGGVLTNCTIEESINASATSYQDPSDLVGCHFIGDGTGYALEIPNNITSNTSVTWDCTFDTSTYAASSGTAGNEVIKCNVVSGNTLTINVTDAATTPTVHNTGLGIVILSIGKKTFSFTLNPSIIGYEWRLYVKDPIDGVIGTVELDGEETATADNQAYLYTYISDRDVVLQIIAADYEESLTLLTLSNADQSLTVNLSLEENT